MARDRDLPKYILKFQKGNRTNYVYAYTRALARTVVKEEKAKGRKLIACWKASYTKGVL